MVKKKSYSHTEGNTTSFFIRIFIFMGMSTFVEELVVLYSRQHHGLWLLISHWSWFLTCFMNLSLNCQCCILTINDNCYTIPYFYVNKYKIDSKCHWLSDTLCQISISGFPYFLSCINSIYLYLTHITINISRKK